MDHCNTHANSKTQSAYLHFLAHEALGILVLGVLDQAHNLISPPLLHLLGYLLRIPPIVRHDAHMHHGYTHTCMSTCTYKYACAFCLDLNKHTGTCSAIVAAAF